MKQVMLGLIALVATFSIQAQIKTPQPSPLSKMEQTVGLTNVTLEYSRPSMRGREVFGNLVPYGKMWRTGANANTKISFSDAIIIDGKTLKAGTYAIYTIPNETSWDVIFYTDSENSGLPKTWDDSKVALKAQAQVYPMPVDIETFTMTFDDLTNDSAVLGMLWGQVYAGVKFEVPTDVMVMKNIENTMKGSPTANDYYASAVYYFESGKDINQAKTWIDKSITMTPKPAFWQLRKQSLILAKSGDKKGAIAAAKKSLASAEAAGNSDYVKMNTDSLKEWGAL
ncbi:DUF2911 domain-containing protein [Formosa sp. PL04]|uniref:DUF2911 domain-containing protein n=1 Tax=Formosa sp. PL04 TaxID=3081755 RepID=UPI0029824904|nr:DUF2911 domain-containing protein [Formosa sp. PL04]MDW5288439.1 DUF2911 domain-containing protein [Formosa sp. PL04]